MRVPGVAPLRAAPPLPQAQRCVERAQRTHTEEFYEFTACALELGALNRGVQAWEHTYNTVHPHQAMGYLTPQQFLGRHDALREQAECHRSIRTSTET